MNEEITHLIRKIGEIEECLTLESALWKIGDTALHIFSADSTTIIEVFKRPYTFAVLKNVDTKAAAELEEKMRKEGAPKNLEIVKEKRTPFILSDTYTYDFWVKAENSPRSWIGIPIIVNGNVGYILNVDKQTPHFFNDSHLKLAEAFSYYISQAVSKIKLLEDYFRIATLDHLTHANTRQSLFDILKRNIEKYIKFGTKFTCLMLDLDKFKEINDTYGHEKGDEALKLLTQTIKENIRASDYIFRFGGDEFIIKLENATVGIGIDIAKRIKLSLSKEKIDETIQISASIGIKEYKGEKLEEFIKALDEALYKAKNSKNGIAISD